MKDKRVILFTATLEEYFKRAFDMVFGLRGKGVIGFPTAHMVAHGSDIVQKINVNQQRTKERCIDELLKALKARMKN